MKKVITILIISLFSLSMYSQDSTDIRTVEKSGIQYGIDAGASVMSFGGGESMYCSYFAPNASLPLSSRFRLRIGGMMVNTNLYGVQPSNSELTGYTVSNGAFSTFLYMNGSYQLSTKVIVSGSVLKSVNRFNNTNAYNPILDIYQFGVEYKITENFRIGLDVKYIKSDMPLLMYGNRSLSRQFFSPMFW